MKKIIYQPGQKIGEITFIKEIASELIGLRMRRRALFECPNCGKHYEATIESIKHGRPLKYYKGCGCKQAHRHGGRKSPLYGVWDSMIQRCTNPNNTAYKNYGGRGISVCAEWQEFILFRAWAKHSGYNKNLTIDRINNDGNYGPLNCRWTTRHIQSTNTRDRVGVSSIYRGVSFRKDTGKWDCRLKYKGTLIYLGNFKTEREAAIARDKYIIRNNLTEYKLNILKR